MKTTMKFGDMLAGQKFKEIGKGRKARKFIKLQTVLPSGIKMKYATLASEDYAEYKVKKDDLVHWDFNSIDSEGMTATCPDWLEFECITSL